MKQPTDDVWVLEWSRRQNCLHVQPLAALLSRNRQLYRDNVVARDDYRPLFVGSEAECRQAAATARHTLKARAALHRVLVEAV